MLATVRARRRRAAHRRRPARHDRRRRPRAAAAPPQRAAAQEPVRVRHPPAVAEVLHQGRAAAARSRGSSPGRVDGRGREGAGLRAAVHLQPRHRHHVPDRRRGRGLADHRRRHPEGADGPQPGVHLRASCSPPPRWPASSAPRSWGSAPSPRSSATPASRSRKQAPLPVTTGNSYSASGALWAAHEALDRLGLAEVDDEGRIRGKAMVVGATGAIGSVCARLLALASDELWLVSPETAKLLALKHDIEREHPRRRGARRGHPRRAPRRHGPDRHRHLGCRQAGARHHGRQAGLRDHRRRPPARPLGRGRRQAPRRPRRRVRRDRAARRRADAETSACRRASPTPAWPRPSCWPSRAATRPSPSGRNIEWEKVKEIYRLGLKHGMRLAAISGVNGVFTDEDFARVRELALAARSGSGGPAPRRHARLTTVPTPASWPHELGNIDHGRCAPVVVPRPGQRTSCPGCGSAGMVPSRPAWKSSKACTSSSRVFMTNGP